MNLAICLKQIKRYNFSITEIINNQNKGNKMKYQKPQVIAKNNPKGSFAAGCPTNTKATVGVCRNCEIVH